MTAPTWLDRRAWPWAARYAGPPGRRLHYVDEGHPDAAPVVLVHGTPTWSFEWRHLIPALAVDRRVVAVDHLGFGLSDRPADAGYRPEDHADRFRAFMDTVVPHGPVDLVVHDFGGPIALAWALDHPERVSRLVVINSWMWSFADDAAMARKARFASGALGRWLYRRLNASLRLIMPSAYGDRSRLTADVHAHYLQVFPDADSRERVLFALATSLLGSSDWFDGLWQRRARLARVDLSIIWGLKDPAFPPAMLARWRTALPEARVTELPGAGHWPHEEQPDLVAAALGRGGPRP